MIRTASRDLSFQNSVSRLLIATTFVTGCLSSMRAAEGAPSEIKKLEGKVTKIENQRRSTQKTAEKRKAIESEAVASLRETQDALKALDEGKTNDALASLERATGKLEILLARNPKMALVPIDVRVVTTDVSSSLEEIRKARQEAEKDLREGRVQEARSLLSNLASETVISTTNIPLANYPSVLKTAAKLIDEKKSSEAKAVLQAALDTLIVTDVVIPLPVTHAKIFLEKAEDLAKIKNRTKEQNKQLADFVAAADTEINYAQELGYGKKPDFDSFHKQIKDIRQKTAPNKSGTGFFDQIKTSIESMTKSSQHKPKP